MLFLPQEATTGQVPLLAARIIGGQLLADFAHPLSGDDFPPEEDPAAALTRLLALTPVMTDPEDPTDPFFPWDLYSDYGPSNDLQDVAEAAGVVCTWARKFRLVFTPSSAVVGVRARHGGPLEYYYPVSDGRVLTSPKQDILPLDDLGLVSAGALPEDGSLPTGAHCLEWNWRVVAAQLDIPIE
jgi:hypothetical protein